MTRTIWKFLLEVKDGIQIVKMPSVSNVISVDMIGMKVSLWAIVDPDSIEVDRRFVVYGTGEAMHENLFISYIGTCIQRSDFNMKPWIWHVFEVLKKEE